MQKNNLVAVLAIPAVVFVRPRLAVHVAFGGQEVGVTARRLGSKPERNNEGQRPSLARTPVILARRSPTEKLSLN